MPPSTAMLGVLAQRRMRTATDAAPPPSGGGYVDLTVELAPIGPQTSGADVQLTCTVTNNGTVATPAGTVCDVVFYDNGDTCNWSDTVTAALAPGASRSQPATGGPFGTATWHALGGTHTITCVVNVGTPSRPPIDESNTGNNSDSEVVVVSGGVGEPTLPANAVVGQASWKSLYYGGVEWLYNSSQYSTWFGRGAKGFDGGFRSPYGLGGQWDFQGAAVGPGLPDTNPFFFQSFMEGAGGTMATAKAAGYFAAMGWYFHEESRSDSGAPVFGDYYNDALWSAATYSSVASTFGRFAQAIEFMNMDAMLWDSEINGLGWTPAGYTGHFHTVAEDRAELFLRGQQIAIKMWTAKPDLILFWYNNYPHFGFNSKIQQVVNGIDPNTSIDLQVDLLCGLLDGMRQVNATGSIQILDAQFFRFAANPLPGCQDRAAYQLNNFGGRAFYSQWMPQATWNYACRDDGHLFIVGFNWRGTDGTAYYDATFMSEGSWALTRGFARLYSEGLYQAEYNGPGENAPWNGPLYSGSIAINGAIDAANPAAVSSSLPTITSAVASAAADTVTVVCTHPAGVYSVKIYDGSIFNAANPEASYLGAARMTWTENGGHYTTNYDASYQTAVFSPIGGVASTQRFVVKVTSAKGDYKWQNVQAP